MPDTISRREAAASEFAELICADPAWLRAEFEAIVATCFDDAPLHGDAPGAPGAIPSGAKREHGNGGISREVIAHAQIIEVAFTRTGSGPAALSGGGAGCPRRPPVRQPEVEKIRRHGNKKTEQTRDRPSPAERAGRRAARKENGGAWSC